MGISVGIPTLRLSSGGAQGKHTGNTNKVAEEMGVERYSKDQDLDRNLSHLNQYTPLYTFEDGTPGTNRGKDLARYWDELASKKTDKLGRKLKSTACKGFSLVIKPSAASPEWQAMTPDEKDKFLDDSEMVMKELLESKGLTVDFIARHKDEKNEHTHVAGHDEDFQLNDKMNRLSFYTMLNKTFPERMRQLGYNVENMTQYDPEATKDMDEDELRDYKAQHIAKKKSKKQSGRSSERFKAEADAEKIREEAQAEAERLKEQARTSYKAQEDDLQAQMDKFTDEKEKWQNEANTRSEEQDKRQRELDKREDALEVQERALQEKYEQLQAKELKIDSEVSQRVSEGTSEKLKELQNKIYKADSVITQAEGVTKGYDVNAFVNTVEQLVRSDYQMIKYNDGQTAWDKRGKYVVAQIQKASQNLGQNSIDERKEKMRIVRGLPDTPDKQNESENEFGY